MKHRNLTATFKSYANIWGTEIDVEVTATKLPAEPKVNYPGDIELSTVMHLTRWGPVEVTSRIHGDDRERLTLEAADKLRERESYLESERQAQL